MNRAQWSEALGLGPLWVARHAPIEPASPGEAAALPAAENEAAHSPAYALEPTPAAPTASMDWDTLESHIRQCTACTLCETRTQAVPGVGDRQAQWLIIGEAPGAEEDRQGEPFVGRAGQLLDAMLAALGLNRQHGVYIANVLKCRPPNNRDPHLDEISACRGYLERQISLINPKIILCVGKHAATTLLGLSPDTAVGKLRGQVHRVHNIPTVITYHPAYLLRSPSEKARVWHDLLLARRSLTAN